MKKRRIFVLMLALAMVLSLCPAVYAAETDPLSFSDSKVSELSITLDGEPATVRMYEDVYCASPNRPEDQQIAVYVPANASKASPILFMVNNGGWQMNGYSSRRGVTDGAAYSSTSDSDVVGKALSEGYVIVSYGCRSRNNGANENGEYLGHSPATMVDTKAAIRYLRYNKDLLPAGDPERIVITGLSGGGALSAVTAASGDSEDYFQYLYEIGAAGMDLVDGEYVSSISDAVWATIAYCPITDLGNACAAYEWTYHDTRERLYEEGLMSYDGVEQEVVMSSSAELKAMFEEYVDSLGLRREDGSVLSSSNLRDTIIALITREIEESLEEIGEDQMLADLGYGRAPIEIPEFTEEELAALAAQLQGIGMTVDQYFAYKGWVEPYDMLASDWADWYSVDENGSVDLDFDEYLYFVARNETLKIASAFSNQGLNYAGQRNEDTLFGDTSTAYSPFNAYAWNNDSSENGVGYDETGLTWEAYMATPEGEYLAQQLKMASPIEYLMDEADGTSAPYWYVRYGMKDRDSSFAIETVLYHAILNDSSVQEINFEFAWLKPHAGDYDVQEAYAWLNDKLHEALYDDVDESDWFYDEVMYCHDSGLMDGMGDYTFAPASSASRAMVVTVLYRLAGSPEAEGTNLFADLTQDWYKDAIQWAVNEGITTGTGAATFDPDASVTREDLATFLYRYAQYMGLDVSSGEEDSLQSCADAAEISDYAVQAMRWAYAEGIITGVTESTLVPAGSSDRAVLATVLCRLMQYAE